MVRVPGVTLEEIEERSERFERLVNRMLDRVARRIAPGIGRVIVAQGGPEAAAASPDDVNGVPLFWSAIVDAELLPVVLEEWLRAANDQGRKIAEIFAEIVDLEIPTFTSTSTAAQAWLANARNRLRFIGDELWQNMRTSLVEGIQNGESIPRLSQRVRDVADITKPGADVIARTEVIGASNAGSITQMRASGLVTNKEWISTHDARTRPTHEAAMGQTVPLDEAFTVGLSSLDYPGDPGGPPGEIINCRCALVYEVDDTPEALQTIDSEETGTSGAGIVADATLTETLQEETECPPGHHRMPDGECMPDAAMNSAPFEGVLAVEGVRTGDGRMFALDSLKWADLPLPLRWQREDTHGGMQVNGVVTVGRIDEIMRVGKEIRARGVLDLGGPDGVEVRRRMAEGFLSGVSVDVDNPEDPSGTDIELIFPCDDETEMECQIPELMVFHSGRIRAATLVDLPAFTEAKVQLLTSEPLTAAAVRSHDTPTTDEPWDGPANEARLPSPMSIETARNAYAWIDEDAVEDGEMPKSAGKFIHHEVNEDGTPGAANLIACSTGIGVLHGGRGGTTVPSSDHRGIYDHLARHIRDAGREPPPFSMADEVEEIVASAHTITIPDTPPAEWFAEPTGLPAIGAVTVTDDGRVYGYLAPKNVAHRAHSARRVEVPSRNVDYSRWMNRPTIVEGGGRLETGVITMDCGHAAPVAWVGAEMSRDHYDNSCSVVATVRIGENRKGTWIAGALLHDVSPSQVARMLACQLSGDWRPHRDKPGTYEFVGALLVPVPGFPMESPRARLRMVDDVVVSSAVPVTHNGQSHQPVVTQEPVEDFGSVMELLASTIGRDDASRLDELSSLVHSR